MIKRIVKEEHTYDYCLQCKRKLRKGEAIISHNGSFRNDFKAHVDCVMAICGVQVEKDKEWVSAKDLQKVKTKTDMQLFIESVREAKKTGKSILDD
jgi:hypothetical protein